MCLAVHLQKSLAAISYARPLGSWIHGLLFSQQCFLSGQSTARFAPCALGCRAPIMTFVARAMTAAQTHLRLIAVSGWCIRSVRGAQHQVCLVCCFLRILQSGAHLQNVRTLKSAWFCTGSGCPGFTGYFFALLPNEPLCRLFQASISVAGSPHVVAKGRSLVFSQATYTQCSTVFSTRSNRLANRRYQQEYQRCCCLVVNAWCVVKQEQQQQQCQQGRVDIKALAHNHPSESSQRLI